MYECQRAEIGPPEGGPDATSEVARTCARAAATNLRAVAYSRSEETKRGRLCRPRFCTFAFARSGSGAEERERALEERRLLRGSAVRLEREPEEDDLVRTAVRQPVRLPGVVGECRRRRPVRGDLILVRSTEDGVVDRDRPDRARHEIAGDTVNCGRRLVVLRFAPVPRDVEVVVHERRRPGSLVE